MSSAYANLRPVLRLFVDAVVAGEKPTHAVRRLRPHLERPNVLASKWKARPEVQAAIAERLACATDLEAYVTDLEAWAARLEGQIAALSAAVRCRPRK